MAHNREIDKLTVSLGKYGLLYDVEIGKPIYDKALSQSDRAVVAEYGGIFTARIRFFNNGALDIINDIECVKKFKNEEQIRKNYPVLQQAYEEYQLLLKLMS